MSIEAMKQALEALQVATTPLAKDRQEVLRAIKALEEALAKQEQQEPVGEAYLCDRCYTPFDGAYMCPSCGHNQATKEAVYTHPQPKAEQGEPVAQHRDLHGHMMVVAHRASDKVTNNGQKFVSQKEVVRAICKAIQDDKNLISKLTPPAKQDQDKPVAVVTGVYGGRFIVEPTNSAMVLPVNMALYTHPQPRKPLTDEQKKSIARRAFKDICKDYPVQDRIILVINDIEAAHGIGVDK